MTNQTEQTKKNVWKEWLAVVVVVGVLVGLPAALFSWQAAAQTPADGENTKIISLTATGEGGIWTTESIAGHNYWRREFTRATDIPLRQGDHVVLRLTSADLLHSFAIPILRIGPVDVPAGHTVEVKFDATRAGTLTFLCWQVCSPDHGKLRGRFIVEGTESEEEDEEW